MALKVKRQYPWLDCRLRGAVSAHVSGTTLAHAAIFMKVNLAIDGVRWPITWGRSPPV